MTIRYQFSLDDLRHLHRENQRNLSRRFADPLPYKIWLYLLAPATIVAISVLSGSFAIGAATYALYWGTSVAINRWNAARYSRNYYTEANFKRSLLPFELELLDDRLLLRNAVLVHEHYWHSFHFLRESTRYLHLFFSPISSLSVPKSAFSSDAELEAFRNLVKAHQTVRV